MELAETASTHIVDNTFAIYCFKKGSSSSFNVEKGKKRSLELKEAE